MAILRGTARSSTRDPLEVGSRAEAVHGVLYLKDVPDLEVPAGQQHQIKGASRLPGLMHITHTCCWSTSTHLCCCASFKPCVKLTVLHPGWQGHQSPWLVILLQPSPLILHTGASVCSEQASTMTCCRAPVELCTSCPGTFSNACGVLHTLPCSCLCFFSSLPGFPQTLLKSIPIETCRGSHSWAGQA
jgi:hypothetical protein